MYIFYLLLDISGTTFIAGNRPYFFLDSNGKNVLRAARSDIFNLFKNFIAENTEIYDHADQYVTFLNKFEIYCLTGVTNTRGNQVFRKFTD